jgi:hypothetical protein
LKSSKENFHFFVQATPATDASRFFDYVLPDPIDLVFHTLPLSAVVQIGYAGLLPYPMATVGLISRLILHFRLRGCI